MGRGQRSAGLLALALVIAVLMLPSTPAGANPIYSPTPDPGTVPIIYTVNTIAHMTVNAAEATAWPPVIGRTDFVRWDINLQEDITAGKIVYDLQGPNGPIAGAYPICGVPPSSRPAPPIPAFGPNVTAGSFVVWPVGTRALTHLPVPCPIKAGDYNTGLVPFRISDDVVPGTYSGSILVTDQTGGVILKTTWDLVLTKPSCHR